MRLDESTTCPQSAHAVADPLGLGPPHSSDFFLNQTELGSGTFGIASPWSLDDKVGLSTTLPRPEQCCMSSAYVVDSNSTVPACPSSHRVVGGRGRMQQPDRSNRKRKTPKNEVGGVSRISLDPLSLLLPNVVDRWLSPHEIRDILIEVRLVCTHILWCIRFGFVFYVVSLRF